MPVDVIQLPIVLVLFFTLFYGMGFILNMLLKTTWLPIYLYIILVIPLAIYWQYDASKSFIANLGAYHLVDYLTAIAGLIGTFAGGATIKLLRDKGFRMF